MEINHQYDEDNCIAAELIPNKVEWHKEKNGDNILLQYINGGEGVRAIERFSEDVHLSGSHYNGKSLFVMTSTGEYFCYHQDKRGNFKSLKTLQAEKNALRLVLSERQIKK